MDKDWTTGSDGHNSKYKRETLLNYAMNRWGLNKAASVGATSELIRACAPKDYNSWVEYYFQNAFQKKKDGQKITHQYIEQLGKELYLKLTERVQNELSNITEEECIDYVYNLVINRTYEGYRTEIDTIYGHLERELGCKIESAPDEWDRNYSVDFFIRIGECYIGLQIKPVTTMEAINGYQWIRQNTRNHERFTAKYKGKVFFVYSQKVSGRKQIANPEVIDEIKSEINRLERL